MALWPLSDFQAAQEGGSTTATSGTVSVTAASTAHVKGAWQQLIASTTDEAYGLTFGYVGPSSATTDASAVMDVGIGAAGAEVVLIPDLLIGAQSVFAEHTVRLPIRVPRGSRVSVRIASSTASDAFPLHVYALSGGVVPAEAASVAESLGVGTASGGTSSGTPAATHTKGPWVELGTSTRPARFALLCPNKPVGTADAGAVCLMDLGIGPAGAETVLISNARSEVHPSEFIKGGMLLQPCRIPAGTRFAIRHQGAAITAASIPRAAVTLFN